jgi:hypothetical protein
MAKKRVANRPTVISQSVPAELLGNGPQEEVGYRTSLADKKASNSQYSWRSFRIDFTILEESGRVKITDQIKFSV